MPAIITNFPLVAISDGIISFLQYIFGNAEITPSDFRWNADDRQTKIFIGGPYTITRDKVGAMPSITVARGNFSYHNRFIDNLESADAITQENPKYRDLMQGSLSIICEANVGSEATGLASFISIELQANRHPIAGALKFVHKMKWLGISAENPIEEQAEVTRWQCIISFDVMLYQAYFKREMTPQPFNKLNIYAVDALEPWNSIYGETTIGSPNLVDNSADFGFLSANDPQFLESEFDKRWYYVTFSDTEPKKYTVEQIINNKTLKLSYVNSAGDTVDFNPGETEKNIPYTILWNSVHLNIELPKKT